MHYIRHLGSSVVKTMWQVWHKTSVAAAGSKRRMDFPSDVYVCTPAEEEDWMDRQWIYSTRGCSYSRYSYSIFYM